MKFEWECFYATNYGEYLHRGKVIGGWLVKMKDQHGDNHTDCLTFVPDPDHSWSVEC